MARATATARAILFYGYLLGPRRSEPGHAEAWGAADVEDWIGGKLGLRRRDAASPEDGTRHAGELLRGLAAAPEAGLVRGGLRLRYSWDPEYQTPVAFLSVAESERVATVGRPAMAHEPIPQLWEKAVHVFVQEKLRRPVWEEFLGVWAVIEPFEGPRPGER